MSALPPKATAKADTRKRSCPLWANSGHQSVTCPSCGRDGRYNLRVLIEGVAARVLLMDEFDKPRLELLAKLAEQLASLQRECSELRRELDERIKVQQEQLTQLAALKAKYDQLCRERDDFRRALEEQQRLNPAFCVMPDPNTEH